MVGMLAVAGQASAGQERQRSAPPSRGSSGAGQSSSQGSGKSTQSDRGNSQSQSQRRESAAPSRPQQTAPSRPQQSAPSTSRNDSRGNNDARANNNSRPSTSTRGGDNRTTFDSRNNSSRNNDVRGNDSRTFGSGRNDSRNNNDSRYDSRSVPQRQAIPAQRDRYVDLNRNGRDDRYDNRSSGIGGFLGALLGSGRDGRYSQRYTPRYGYSSSYRYNDYRYGSSRIYIAPRNYTRFSSSWFSFRPYSRLSVGLTMGYPVLFPTWYDPYVVGSKSYTRPSMPYGGVSFDVEPRDADLWVDGEYMGPVSDYTSYDPPLTLVAGRHHIELALNDDRALEFDITVVAGQVIPYQGTIPYIR